MLVVPGCTQSAATANIAASTPAANPEGSAAVVLADALARADAAATTGKDADLTQPLAIIAMLNAQPLDESGRAELAAWQVRNPEQSAPMRGRTLGPGYRHGTLNAGGDLRIEQTFLSGQKASIALSSPSGARLQLQVIDGKEQPVCQNVAARPSCAWTPMFTQRHVIHLTNPGNQTTRFYLVIE
jgi:hypothetical protein